MHRINPQLIDFLARGDASHRRLETSICALDIFANLTLWWWPIRRFGKNPSEKATGNCFSDGMVSAAMKTSMNRLGSKAVLVSILALVLLYYSVAWAVLICLHADERFDGPAVLATASVGDQAKAFSRPHRRALIDCTEVDYHVETLAPPASNLSLGRFLAGLYSIANDLSGSPARAADFGPTVGYEKASLTRSPPHSLPELPLYISLSVLRI